MSGADQGELDGRRSGVGLVNYLELAASKVEAALRRIKGDDPRKMIRRAVAEGESDAPIRTRPIEGVSRTWTPP